MAISDTMKPALKSLVEAEFQRVGYDPNAASKASRAVKGDGAGAALSAGGVIPRVDLNSLLDRNILTDLTSTDGKNSWQSRKTALETIIQACERSGHFLEFNSTTRDLAKALKDRLTDTQANLKPLGATAIGHLLSSLEMEQSSRLIRGVIGDPLVAGVSDNKKVMRDACIASLQMIVSNGKTTTVANTENAVSPESTLLIALLPSISEAALNPVGRLELLGWLLSQLEMYSSSNLKFEWAELLRALVVAMQDKIAATRSLAEQIFCSLMSHGFISRNDVSKSFRDLPPATLRPLQSAVDRILSTPSSSSGNGLNEGVRANPPSPTKKEKDIDMSRTQKLGSTNRLKSSDPVPNSAAGGDDTKFFPLKKTMKVRQRSNRLVEK